MIYLVLGLATLTAVLLVVVPRLEARCTNRSSREQHLWALASANTLDGVTARIEIDFVVDSECLDPKTTALIHAVEDLLRLAIATSSAEHLPSMGDDPTVLIGDVVEGVALERAVVTTSDIEVTPEFRRLMGART